MRVPLVHDGENGRRHSDPDAFARLQSKVIVTMMCTARAGGGDVITPWNSAHARSSFAKERMK